MGFCGNRRRVSAFLRDLRGRGGDNRGILTRGRETRLNRYRKSPVLGKSLRVPCGGRAKGG